MQAPTGNLPTAAPEQLDLPAPSVCRARCAALPVAAFEHVLGSRLEALGRMPAPPALVPSDIVRLSQQYVWPSSRRPVLRNAGPARARQWRSIVWRARGWSGIPLARQAGWRRSHPFTCRAEVDHPGGMSVRREQGLDSTHRAPLVVKLEWGLIVRDRAASSRTGYSRFWQVSDSAW